MWTCEDCKFELVQDTDLICKACKAGLCAFVLKEDKKENLDIKENKLDRKSYYTM